jgi:predicted permease
MQLAITAFNQILIMFIIILVGMMCYKFKVIDNDLNKKLSDIVLILVNPFVIFVAYQRKFEASLLKGLLISLLLALITHLFGLLISFLFLKKKNREEEIAIERFAVIYSNCGFIGIPLVSGIVGSEGVFYLTAYITMFNLFLWTHGVITMSGKSDKKTIRKAIFSPSILSVVIGFLFFILRILLPATIVDAFNYIGSMNTPLAMLVSGVTIAQTDIKQFRKFRLYYITFFKLLFVPIVLFFLFNSFNISKEVLLTAIIAAACPTAATINLFSIRYNKNYLYSSELFAITTVLSLVTIPLVMILINMLV